MLHYIALTFTCLPFPHSPCFFNQEAHCTTLYRKQSLRPSIELIVLFLCQYRYFVLFFCCFFLCVCGLHCTLAMKQETVCAFPAELFSVGNSGASSSKGACVCAVVVLPSRPPKYTLVCYNAQQVTFCVARMNWVDGQNTSLRLVVAPSGHVSFTDDTSQRWTLFFAEDTQLTRFLACVGVAFYSLYGAPATTVFFQNLSLPSSSLQLEAADKATVAFTGFELREKNGVCSVGAMTQHRGTPQDASTAPYVFSPRLSALQLSQGCFGFEGSVIGMREDDRRVFVLPAGYTTSVADSLTGVAAEGAVYVVQLQRIEHAREDDAVSAKSATAGAAQTAAPPSVYAATADAVDSVSNTRALALVEPSSTAVATTAAAVPAFLSPSGIPPEHMSVLRKVELGVNAAVAGARDVHDVTAVFSQEWRQHMERPKPSLLSNKALLEQVQRVVTEEETAQAHLDECDRLLQALDARNKELQQRIDRATIESQKLLEEKNNASTKATDARLERDRQLVRLKDALLLKLQEHEDLQRHINALQRAVDVSNEELRQVQGRRDVHQVEVNNMAERLSAMQETLSEERHRNAALVAKLSLTDESLKKALAQQRVAEGQLTTARGLAEKERLRYVQMMEEERHHRAQDSELLRQDILHELDERERQFHVDRRRLAEEEFNRGLRDGKAEGRQAAETDLLGHQDELRLTLQRAKTEAETTKEEVRRAIESAMALRRTLGGKVNEMEAQLASATRQQTQLQCQVAQWQTRCRTVRDTIGAHWRTLTSYATHPCTRAELLAMMKAVRAAEEASYADDVEGEEGLVRVDLQFQQELWQQSRQKSVEQRLRWISEDMVELFVKGADYHFAHEWERPVTEAHAATLEAVAELFVQKHGSRALFDVGVQEAQERYALQRQWWVTIKDIEDWLAAQRAEQEAVRAEEAKLRLSLWKAYMDGGDAIVQLCAAQLRAQVVLLQDEMKGRDDVAAAEAQARARLPAAAQLMWAADCEAAQHLLEEEEEAVRAGLEAEAYTESSGITFQFSYARRGVEEAELRRRKREAVQEEECTARQAVESDAAAERETIAKAAAAALAPPPPPLTAYEEEPPHSSASPADVAAPQLTEGTALRPTDAAQQTVAAAVSDAPSSSHAPASKDAPASLPAEAAPTAEAHSFSLTPPLPPTPGKAAANAPLRHADPSPPLLPTPPAAPAFTFNDPLPVSGDVPSKRMSSAAAATESPDAEAKRADLVFSDVPPPLSSSDNDGDDANDAVKNTAETCDKNSLPQVALPPSLPPPLPASLSTLSKPTQPAAVYADRDAPPPLLSDEDAASTSSRSSSAEDTFSSAPSAAPAPAQTAVADIEIDDDAEAAAAAGIDPAPATSKNPKYMFGGSSSEEDSDSGADDDDGRRADSAPRHHQQQQAPPQPAVRASAKPKLFDSSDDD